MNLSVASPQLLAQVQTDVLGRSLLIALLVVSPYGIYKWRQVSRLRAERAAALRGDERVEPTGPRLEDVVDEISTISETGSGSSTIRIPHGVTVDGEPAPRALVDALVRDAMRRSGLVATAEVETSDARVIECAPMGSGPNDRRAAR